MAHSLASAAQRECRGLDGSCLLLNLSANGNVLPPFSVF